MSAAGSGGESGAAGVSGQIADAGPSDGSVTKDSAAPHDGGSDASKDAAHDSGAAPGKPYVYVSGYASEITSFSLDETSGALSELDRVEAGTSPSYLAIAHDKRTLYAINEAGGVGSQVIAFAIDAATGALTEINRVATSGEGSPHLAVHPSDQWLAVAHYGSGHTTILPLRADGGVEAASDIERGPGDSCGKAHQAVFDASGAFLFVPCLESNYVIQFTFADGELDYNSPATVSVLGGPRHMAFSPDYEHAYVLSELESTITSFAYDSATGKLSDPQTIDSYETTKGASAHIVVHPSGDFLYVSNRTENTLGLFSIGANGRPQAVDFISEMVATPRDFTIDPAGDFLISANQSGAENLLVFRVAATTGMLTRVQTAPVGGQPTFVGVVLLP